MSKSSVNRNQAGLDDRRVALMVIADGGVVKRQVGIDYKSTQRHVILAFGVVMLRVTDL